MTSNPPTQVAFTAGQLVDETDVNLLVDGINYLTGTPRVSQPQRPFAVLKQTVVQTVSTSTTTAVFFDAEDVDTDNGHSTSSSTSRYTAQTAGWFDVQATAVFAASSTGTRQAFLQVNGTGAVYGECAVPAATVSETALPSADTLHLGVGDYVELKVWQNTGGNLNTSLGRHGSRLRVRWMAP